MPDEALHITTPMPMEGGGAYNRSSRVQAAGLAPAVALFEHAAQTVGLAEPPQPIVIADYGASEGHNSLAPMAAAIGSLRRRSGTGRAISVVHTDLPENDFSGLFRTLATDPESYCLGDPAIFPCAIGRSFYEQILPSDTVTLGWSSWSIQWLSRAPVPIPDHVQVAYSRDPAARAAFAGQAAKDWRAFLEARGHELRVGGRLVVMTMATDDAGEFGYRPLLEAIHAGLAELVHEGVLSAAELHRMVIPTVGRSRADFMEPFDDDSRFAELTIEHFDLFHAEDRIWTRFEASRDTRSLGAEWAAFSRASVFPTLAAALESGGDQQRAGEFIDRLESGVAERLAAAPQRMLIPLAKMLLVRGPGARR